MAPSKQLLVALLLGVLVGHAHGIEGDVIAASDFRSGTQEWQLKGLGSATGWSSDGLQSEGDVIAAIDSPSDTGRTWYYSAPKAFLGGDKSLAYNGWLVFDFGHFEYESMGLPVMDGFDVYLQAKNKKNSLGIKGVFKMDDNKLSNTYSVRLEEDFVPPNSTATWEMVNVQKVVNGRLVTKAPTQHEFITCLQTLAGIWIRGSYFKGSEASWLKNVKIIQGAVNKGGNPLGAVATLVNGSLVYDDKNSPPTASSTCCSSRTCVSNDKYEISFDRPGCMQSSDMYCCMGSDGCRRYSRYYDKSTAHDVIRQTDNNEGRAFFTPGTVNKCKGPGSGQYGAQFSSCHSVKELWGGDNGTAGATHQAAPAEWNTGTKNQNMGLQAIPIQKPFVKDYYMSSIPRICSPATLTVEAHGDLAEAKDNIMVYGEDDVYLGTIFAGNLTYLREGQRAYDAYGPNTDCDGTYDPNVPGTDANARLADPHHPTGNRPQYKGYRGGRNDVVNPGVQGNEDTRCRRWMPGGQQPLSLEHSESTPYVDSIAISQDRMMQYSADGQIKFTFRSVRDDSTPNSFSGTGGGGSTRFCNFGTVAGDCSGATGGLCQGCDLDGKVIFRSIKLKFSAGVCFSKSAANDVKFTYEPRIHTAQNLNISVTYSVPSGATGQPGGDAAFSITAGADIFGLDKKLEIYDKDLNKIGDLFARESFQSLRTHISQQSDLKINCDTTSPIVGTERCKPAENQWNMKNVLLNYTDTIRIPRETIAKLAVDGKVTLYIAANSPANAFSLTSYGSARFSPITLAYPLMHCFMKAIKTGPNFGIFLERPMSYYFKETGFPMPAGDVTVFVAASWQQHVRYVTRHVGVAINNKFAYDGTEDGLPVMRVDKDTVGDMGSVWIYKNSDGKECCPSTHRPSAADGMHAVSAYSNCLGKSGSCTDPWVSSEDECTESNPCPTAVAAAGSDQGNSSANPVVPGILKGTFTNLDATPGMYVSMKLILYAPLTSGATAGITIGTGAGKGTGCSCTGPSCANLTEAKLKITGGGGGGAECTVTFVSNAAGSTICTALGAYQWAPTVSFYPAGHPYEVTCTTTPVFTAVPLAAAAAALAGSYGGNPLAPTGTNIRTITAYNKDTFELFVDAPFVAAPVASNLFRISADLSEDVRTGASTAFSRNIRDGGTPTGSVAVQLPSSVSCQTKVFQTGAVENYNSAGTGTIRLDSTASLYDTAYNSYKVRVTKAGGAPGTAPAYDEAVILSYAGTVSGWLSEAPALSRTREGALSFKLQANSASAVKGNAQAVDGTVAATLATPGDLTPALAAVDDFYNGAILEIDIDGDPSTGDDIYTRKIFDYANLNKEVTIKIPFIRKSLLSGRAAGGGSATAIRLPIAQAPTGTYVNMYILVDIDGYPQTEKDISFTLISAWDLDTQTATVGTMEGTPLVGQTTFTIVESLTNGNLDWPVYEADPAIAAGMRQTPDVDGNAGNARPRLNPSTFRIYGRDAKLSAALTDVAGTKSTLPVEGATGDEGIRKNLGAEAAAGTTQVTLTTPAAAIANQYKNMRLRITEWGVTDEYTITEYTASLVAKLSQPLLRSHSTAATFEILRVYEIYKDLGGNCLENVNMSVTYTYGTARTVGNDPGELSSIYSNWDRGRNQYDGTNAGRVLSPASLPDQRNVQSWVLKLAGEGYYSDLYPAEGLGSYDTNTNKAAGSLVSTLVLVGAASAVNQTLDGFTSTVGLQVGQLIKITNFGPTNSGLSEQFEIVKILSILSGTSVRVARAQMSTIAQAFSAGTLYVYTTGFNRGQGMDEMANLHKDAFARYSASTDNAYKDLFVTVTEGAGAGQTRLIVNYHGDSRTVYVNSPWNIIPDTTSKYKIWYSAEIVGQVATTTGTLAIATFPRPVKKGYLAELKWYDCSEEMPMSFLNNDWFYQTASEKRQGPSYLGRTGGSKSAQVSPGLPVCTGQLGMRRPKLGPPVFYPRFKVLQTQYASGVVTVGCLAAFTTNAATTCVTPRSTSRVVLDKNADTASNAYIGRKIVFTDSLGNPRCTCPDQNSTVQPHATKCAAATNPNCEFTIMQSWLGGTAATTSATGNLYTEIILDQALGFTPKAAATNGCAPPAVCSCTATGAPTCTNGTAPNIVCECHPRLAVTDLYRILPAAGVPGDTTVSETGQNGEQYFMEEVDVVRYEYPELIKQHREWPHGYSYLQMKAGEDGEHIGNLFLKDYTQYSTESYYTDSITIPREMFENYVKAKPNGVQGEFPFTIKTPPGAGNIELLSMVFGYPVLKQEDASSYDSTDISTKRQSSHGPPPFFPHSAAWRGTDEHVSTPKTHPRFQTHAYTSTCGNGVLDAREGCDDANQNDGDGCSSACAVEDGWFCEIKTVASPSICRKGLVGETLLISTPF